MDCQPNHTVALYILHICCLSKLFPFLRYSHYSVVISSGTALRVTTGGKPGQTSLIQIPSSTQFAVMSQGNLLSVGQPRVLQTQLTNQQVHECFMLAFCNL